MAIDPERLSDLPRLPRDEGDRGPEDEVAEREAVEQQPHEEEREAEQR